MMRCECFGLYEEGWRSEIVVASESWVGLWEKVALVAGLEMRLWVRLSDDLVYMFE